MRSAKELKELDKYLVENPIHKMMKQIMKDVPEDVFPTSYAFPYSESVTLLAIVSSSFGWEHVSVSPRIPATMDPKGRTPRWEEMCFIKEKFWGDDEMVVQYHPAKKDYVNNHPDVLHMWKPVDKDYPTPPKELV